MLTARLSHALLQGLTLLPEGGRVAVFGARAGEDLSILGGAVQVVQGFRPDHVALVAQGVDVVTAPSGDFDSALVVLPRAKDQARDRIAQALALVPAGARIWIDGQKTDGADSMIRELRALGTVDPVIAKAHGKLFGFVAAGDLSDWRAGSTMLPDGAITRPGVFSADGVDRGSALLAGLLPGMLNGTVIDLGAGWGSLSRAILTRDGVTALHLVEADHLALDCARHNVTDPRAQFHWADALSFDLTGGADHVVSNPPFHTGRAPDPGLGRGFIAAAARLLKPSGQLWLVANRHLPYETELAERFVAFTDLSDDPAFKVIHAARPRRGRHRPG